jgi:hypothetical protein
LSDGEGRVYIGAGGKERMGLAEILCVIEEF